MEINLSPDQQKDFLHLSFKRKNRNIKGTFPDFMILGPQRTGTTWLAKNLRIHPEIFLSFPKELYFFSRLESQPDRSVHFDNLVKRFSGKTFNTQPKLAKEMVKILYFDFWVTGNYKANQLEWYLQFFDESTLINRKHSLKMKKRYGKPYKPLMFGESTASYAAMSPDIIKEMLQLNPDLKVIIMVREPIQRAWSHAKLGLAKHRNRKVTEITAKEYVEFLKRDYLIACGMYTRQIENWQRFLKPESLLIGQYEDISNRPPGFLKDVFSFLSVSQNEKFISEDVDKVINPTGKGKIPEEVIGYLTELYRDEVYKLENEFGIKFH